jgi:hypothetical protein
MCYLQAAKKHFTGLCVVAAISRITHRLQETCMYTEVAVLAVGCWSTWKWRSYFRIAFSGGT